MLDCLIYISNNIIYNKKIGLILIFTLAIIQFNELLLAQDIEYRNPNTYNFTLVKIKSINESPNNKVLDIAEGINNVYIITKNELYVYDGNRFTKVLHNITKNNRVLEFTDIISDYNELYIATKKSGVWKYNNGKLELIYTYNFNTKNISFFQIKNDHLYFYKKNGDAFYLDTKNMLPPSQLPIKIIKHHNKGNNSTIISNNRKLYKWYNTEYNHLINVPYSDFEEYLYLGSNKMIFLVNKKLYFLDQNKIDIIPLLDGISVYSIKQYDKQNILLLTSSGCFMLDTTLKITFPFHSKFKNITGELSFVDRDKNIWIYNSNQGLIMLQKEGITYLRPYLISDFQPQQIEYLKSQIFVQAKNQNYILDIAYNPVEPVGLPDNIPVNVIQRYESKRLWVSIDNRLFFSDNLPIFSEVKLPNSFKYIKNGIFAIFQQDDLNFWVLTQNNLFHFLLSPQLKSTPNNPIATDWFIKYEKYDQSKGIIPLNLSPLSGVNKYIKMFQGENNKLCIGYEDKIIMKFGQYFRPIYTFVPKNSLLSVEYSMRNRNFYALTKKGIEILKNGVHKKLENWRTGVSASFKGQLVIEGKIDILWWYNNNSLFSYNTNLKSLNILEYDNQSNGKKKFNDVYNKNKLVMDNKNNVMLASRNDIIFFNRLLFSNNNLKINENQVSARENSVKTDNSKSYSQLSLFLLTMLVILSLGLVSLYFLFQRRKKRDKILDIQNKKRIKEKLTQIKQQQSSLMLYKLTLWMTDYIILFLLRNSLLTTKHANSSYNDKDYNNILSTITVINSWYQSKNNIIKFIDTPELEKIPSTVIVKNLRNNIEVILKTFDKIVGLNKDIVKVNITGIDKLKNIYVNDIEAVISLMLTFVKANNSQLFLDLIKLNYENNNLKLEFVFSNYPFQGIISLSELMAKEEVINLQKISIIGILSLINRVLKVNTPLKNHKSVDIETTKNTISLVWYGVT